GLGLFPPLASDNGVSPRAVDSTTHSAAQAFALLFRQLDIPHPEADRRARDPQDRGELLDRACSRRSFLACIRSAVFITDNSVLNASAEASDRTRTGV